MLKPVWKKSYAALSTTSCPTAFGLKRNLYDIVEKAPFKLGTLKDDIDALCKGEELHEVGAFAVDNDSLEARSIKRSGATSIPEVQAARDVFFEQKTYKYQIP